MSDKLPETQELKGKKSDKVSYHKTRDSIKDKYVPRHFIDAADEKSLKQRRLEKVRISIRKIKRLNAGLTVLTAVLLFGLFFFSYIIFPKTVVEVDSAAYDDESLTVDFVGDVMFGRYINQIANNRDYDKVFGGVSPYFKNADLTFANLECAVLKDDASAYTQAKKNIHLYCSYDMIDAAREAGINVFGAANNHGFDYGDKPVEELIEYFKKNNVYYSGIGMNIGDAAKFTLIDQNGYRIAFIAITDVFYKEACATADRPGVLTTTYSEYNKLVYDASRSADITIVYFHWGEENEVTSNKEQTALGHRLIDAGADIVIGSHPHVLQNIEKYKDGVIFYSMGNFIFDQGTTFSRDSVIVEMNLDQKGKAEFTLIPIRIDDGAPEVTNNYFYKQRIYRDLTRTLDKDDYYTGDDGMIRVKLDAAFDRTAISRATESTAPTAPTTPSVPSPTTPTTPSVSSPTAPTAPSAPSPTVPTAPSAPSPTAAPAQRPTNP